jgi:hypothetical protein
VAPIIKAQVERDRRELQELADEINPPDFDPVENAYQVRQRGEARPPLPRPRRAAAAGAAHRTPRRDAAS